MFWGAGSPPATSDLETGWWGPHGRQAVAYCMAHAAPVAGVRFTLAAQARHVGNPADY